MMGDTDGALRERFEEPVRAAYEQILAAIEDREPDLAALSKKYQQTLVHEAQSTKGIELSTSRRPERSESPRAEACRGA
jgi:hypothetical protein